MLSFSVSIHICLPRLLTGLRFIRYFYTQTDDEEHDFPSIVSLVSKKCRIINLKKSINQTALSCLEFGDKNCLLVNLTKDTTDPDSADGKTLALNI